MSLTNINDNPRFTKYLVGQKAFQVNPLTVVDVGARGGFESHWTPYGDQLHIIGFEPDAEECARLNEQSSAQISYFPIALDQRPGKRTLYVTKYIASSGLYEPDIKHIQRFTEEEDLTVVRTVELDTVDLDSFLNQEKVHEVDFIKLDTEGTELDILKGSIGLLQKTVLGLSIEVGFMQLHQNQPLFSDVDVFLRDLGFALFDLSHYRYSRKSLPEPRWSGQVAIPSKQGQTIWGQVLYLRDGVNELNFTNRLKGNWNDARILKLASLMEIFCLPDCAIELLQVAQQTGRLQNWNVGHLIDLLVPPVVDQALITSGLTRGQILSYDEYMERITSISSQAKPLSMRLQPRIIRFIPSPIRRIIRLVLIKIRDIIEKVIT
ncbi:MAG: FkbM family methyltransferase [Dehalococcoidia bacterium]|nr:MAG: FkbM family methyltransferase [Dehalococcoidia bacterium]